MKLIDVKKSTYIDFVIENDDKNPKLKNGGHVTVSQYKGIFAKDYTLN